MHTTRAPDPSDHEASDTFPIEHITSERFCPRATYWHIRLEGVTSSQDPRAKLATRLRSERLALPAPQLHDALGTPPIARLWRDVPVSTARWHGHLDLVLAHRNAPTTLIAIHPATHDLTSARLQLAALALAWFDTWGRANRATALLWVVHADPHHEDIIHTVDPHAHHDDLLTLHADLTTRHTTLELPDTPAPASACKACEFIGLCDDDLWRTRDDQDDPIVHELVHF